MKSISLRFPNAISHAFLLLVLSGISWRAIAIEKPGPEVRSRLKRLVESSNFKKSELSIWVGEVAGEVVFESNGETLMMPASLSKLFTAGLVFETLPPEYKFRTQLLSDQAVKSKELKGNIYLKGGGDPSFVSENMWFLVNELTRTGVEKIEGDIIVDDTRFDRIRYSEERESTRVDRAYDAPVGAMSMNWNSVNVYVRPGDKIGAPARVILDPDCGYAQLINKATTKKSGKNLTVERKANPKGDIIEVSGYIGQTEKEHTAYKNISQPDLWAGTNLKCFLSHRNIAVKGLVRTGSTPPEAVVLAVAESKPLLGVVTDMMKVSNNYVAEMLVKNIAAEKGNTPASLEQGMSEFKNFFVDKGFKPDSYTFVNPSGLNRDNRLSSRQIGLFLDQMRSKFSVFPEFLVTLPIAGVDGTLKNRMKNSPARAWVRAKTGLLNGVVGLAGYAGHANGHVFSFSFIYNGAGKEDTARNFFDRLAAALVED